MLATILIMHPFLGFLIYLFIGFIIALIWYRTDNDYDEDMTLFTIILWPILLIIFLALSTNVIARKSVRLASSLLDKVFP